MKHSQAPFRLPSIKWKQMSLGCSRTSKILTDYQQWFLAAFLAIPHTWDALVFGKPFATSALLWPITKHNPVIPTDSAGMLSNHYCFAATVDQHSFPISQQLPPSAPIPSCPGWAVSEQALCLLGKHKLKVFGRAFCQHYQCRVPSCNLQLPSLIIHSNICWWNIIHTGRPAVSCGCLPLFYIHDCTVKLITLHVSIHPQW